MAISKHDVVYLVTERGPQGPAVLATDDNGELGVFVVEGTDGTEAVIRWADDEVELTVPVADLIPVNPLS